MIENFLKHNILLIFTSYKQLVAFRVEMWIVFRIGGLFVLEDTPLEDPFRCADLRF